MSPEDAPVNSNTSRDGTLEVTRSQLFRRRRLTRRRDLSASPQRLPIRRGSGCRRNGRSARSPKRRRRGGWERRSPTRAGMPFTLVGIAGEDDLDTPDLPKREGGCRRQSRRLRHGRRSRATETHRGDGGNDARDFGPSPNEKPVRPARRVLGPEQSAALREQLLADITDSNPPTMPQIGFTRTLPPRTC